MERLIKELIQLEKKRNSLLASINENLKIIASKESSSKDIYEQTLKESREFQLKTGKSAFGI